MPATLTKHEAHNQLIAECSELLKNADYSDGLAVCQTTYYPAGTIAGRTDGALSHIGGLEGNSQRCAGILRANVEDTQLASYIAEGLGEW